MSFFLEHLESQTIPPGDCFKSSDYQNGVIPIKIIDKRTCNTKIYNIELKPSLLSVYSDLSDLSTNVPVDTLLEVESELYVLFRVYLNRTDMSLE